MGWSCGFGCYLCLVFMLALDSFASFVLARCESCLQVLYLVALDWSVLLRFGESASLLARAVVRARHMGWGRRGCRVFGGVAGRVRAGDARARHVECECKWREQELVLRERGKCRLWRQVRARV